MAKAYYFPHDFNSRNDRKIAALVRDFKSSGYGIFWCAAEMMHEENDELEYDDITISAISKDLNEDFELVKKVIDACIFTYKLFKTHENTLTSNRVKKNLNKRSEIKEVRSKAGKASAQSRQLSIQNSTHVEQSATHDEQMSTHVQQNSTKKRKESKRKEIKEKEINIAFPDFWDLYDKKVGEKEKIQKKWDALTDDERTKAIEHIPLYKEAQPDKQYRKDPATYLNNKSFNDEIIPKRANPAANGNGTLSYHEKMQQDRLAFKNKVILE